MKINAVQSQRQFRNHRLTGHGQSSRKTQSYLQLRVFETDNRLENWQIIDSYTRHSTATSKASGAEENKGKRWLTTRKKIWGRKMQTLKQPWNWYETDGSGDISWSHIISSADGREQRKRNVLVILLLPLSLLYGNTRLLGYYMRQKRQKIIWNVQ